MHIILKRALLNALGTTAYVVLVVLFVFSLQAFQQEPDTPLIPMAMLMLLVCSAGITGFLVFGKPLMLYLDGKKKEAVSLLVHTFGMLFIITLLFFMVLLVYYTLVI